MSLRHVSLSSHRQSTTRRSDCYDLDGFAFPLYRCSRRGSRRRRIRSVVSRRERVVVVVVWSEIVEVAQNSNSWQQPQPQKAL